MEESLSAESFFAAVLRELETGNRLAGWKTRVLPCEALKLYGAVFVLRDGSLLRDIDVESVCH